MTLREQQSLFTRLVGELIGWAYGQGYELTLSEAYRSPTEATINARTGAGIVHSLHCERLAIDLNLFKAGVCLTSVEDYRPLGEHWCSMHPLARWGGHFHTRPDADHFSLTYGGIE